MEVPLICMPKTPVPSAEPIIIWSPTTLNLLAGDAVPTPTLLLASIVIAVTVLFTPKPSGMALPVVMPLPAVPITKLPVLAVILPACVMVICCVRVTLFPAVPDGAVKNLCSPASC